jgi:ectoine hydroxylase-related dioxygenase (phytanoyl-CoA dioxygenase family)
MSHVLDTPEPATLRVAPRIAAPQHVTASRCGVVLSPPEQSGLSLSPQHRDLAAQLLHAQGYVILHGAINVPLVYDLHAAFARLLRDCQTTPKSEAWLQTSLQEGAVFWERSSRWRIFPKLRPPFGDPLVVANAFALEILEPLLGADLYCKFVSSDTCLKGAMLQSPHRDFYVPGRRPEASKFIANVPLMECGLQNGPLEVWPGGSHLWDDDVLRRHGVEANVQDGRNEPAEEFARHFDSRKLLLSPGDVLIRDPAMWHRGTPNESDEPRVMLTISYFRRGCDYDYGSVEHNLDPALYEQLDPRAQRVFRHAFDPEPRRGADWLRSLLGRRRVARRTAA